MALINGSDYDHVDMQNNVLGGDITRHMLKDAAARQNVSDLQGVLDYSLPAVNRLFGVENIIDRIRKTAQTVRGITFTPIGGAFRANGTVLQSQSVAQYNFYNDTVSGILVPGEKYKFQFATSDANIKFYVYGYDASSAQVFASNNLAEEEITIPANTAKLIMRLRVDGAGTSVDGYCYPAISQTASNADLEEKTAELQETIDHIDQIVAPQIEEAMERVDDVEQSVSDLESAVRKYNVDNLLLPLFTLKTPDGITFKRDGAGISISGTSAANVNNNLYFSTTVFPDWLSKNTEYYVSYDGPSDIPFTIGGYTSGGSFRELYNSANDGAFGTVKFTDEIAYGALFRLHIDSGKTVNTTVYPVLSIAGTNEHLAHQLDAQKASVQEIDARVDTVQDQVDDAQEQADAVEQSVSDLESAVKKYNVDNLLLPLFSSAASKGITFEKSGAGLKVSGTSSGYVNNNLYFSTTVFPSWLSADTEYRVSYDGPENVKLIISGYTETGSERVLYNSADDGKYKTIQFPAAFAYGALVRLRIEEGETVDGTAYPVLSIASTNEQLTMQMAAVEPKMAELDELKSAVQKYNVDNLLLPLISEKTSNGITFEKSGAGVMISGTSTAYVNNQLYYDVFPEWLTVGKKYNVSYSGPDNVSMYIFAYNAGGTKQYPDVYDSTVDGPQKEIVFSPDYADKIMIRLRVESGETVNGIAYPILAETKTNTQLEALDDAENLRVLSQGYTNLLTKFSPLPKTQRGITFTPKGDLIEISGTLTGGTSAYLDLYSGALPDWLDAERKYRVDFLTDETFHSGNIAVKFQIYGYEADNSSYLIYNSETAGDYRITTVNYYPPNLGMNGTAKKEAATIRFRLSVAGADGDIINVKCLPLFTEESLNQETKAVTLNNAYASMSMFSTIGVIGDSFASGSLHHPDDDGWTSNYALSWPQILGRQIGAAVTNFTEGGLNTKTWLADNNHGLTTLKSSPQKHLYIIALGINDHTATIKHDPPDFPLGTIDDVKSDYTQNPDTFFGNYGRIIGEIHAYAPNSKIICLSVMRRVERAMDDYIRQIAEKMGVPFVDITKDPFFVSAYFYNSFYGNHPVSYGYAGISKAVERLVCNCIVDNQDYFGTYYGLPAEWED